MHADTPVLAKRHVCAHAQAPHTYLLWCTRRSVHCTSYTCIDTWQGDNHHPWLHSTRQMIAVELSPVVSGELGIRGTTAGPRHSLPISCHQDDSWCPQRVGEKTKPARVCHSVWLLRKSVPVSLRFLSLWNASLVWQTRP